MYDIGLATQDCRKKLNLTTVILEDSPINIIMKNLVSSALQKCNSLPG